MPGGSFTPEIFDDSHIWISNWTDFAGTDFDGYPQYYGISDVNTLKFNIWDQACAF